MTHTLLPEESPGESEGVCDKLCPSASPLLAPLSVPLSSTGGSELTPYDVPKLSQGSVILLLCLLELLSKHKELLPQMSDLLLPTISSCSTTRRTLFSKI